MSDEILTHYIYNIIIPGFLETLFMFFVILIISSVFGFLLALLLYNTSPMGMNPNRVINTIVGFLVNIVRSLPVIVLIILLVPFTRMVLGKSIGVKAGIFYITIAAIPFIARVLEGNLREVDPVIIKMARSLGASDFQILMKFVVHEAVPSMVLGTTFSAILISGCISIAGIIGAGGLGEVALNYGYKTYNHFIMNTCVCIMVIFVGVIQLTGNLIYRKLR